MKKHAFVDGVLAQDWVRADEAEGWVVTLTPISGRKADHVEMSTRGIGISSSWSSAGPIPGLIEYTYRGRVVVTTDQGEGAEEL